MEGKAMSNRTPVENDYFMTDRAELIRMLEELKAEKLAASNLLAVIHRDGGHYQDEHGFVKACEDATTKVHALHATYDAE